MPVHGCVAGSVVSTAPSESVRGKAARWDKKAMVWDEGSVGGLSDRGESKEDTTKVVGELFVEQVMCLAAGGVQRVGE